MLPLLDDELNEIPFDVSTTTCDNTVATPISKVKSKSCLKDLPEMGSITKEE
jgi:hypothetical protein